MIQVAFRRHNLEKGGHYDNLAYFVNWKCAMILIARWNGMSLTYAYEIQTVEKVTLVEERLHPDCWEQRHLWDVPDYR